MGFRYREKYRGSVWAGEIIEAYQKAFNIPWWRMLLSTLATIFGIGGIFRLADATYREIDEGALGRFLEKDKTDLEQWVAEDFDCDDHTFRLMGRFHQDRRTAAMPIYITWVMTSQGGHAVLSYCYKGIVHIIEPQKDWIYDVPHDWKLMLLNG